MSTTIQTKDLSSTLVRDEIRDGLRSAASGSHALTDPKSSERPSKSQFVLTSFPDRDPFYPLLVVLETLDDGSRVDPRASLSRHDYEVTIVILARNSTHRFQLRDQVKDWLEGRFETLRDAGYTDVQVGSQQAAFNQGAKVKEERVTIRGNAWTTPS